MEKMMISVNLRLKAAIIAVSLLFIAGCAQQIEQKPLLLDSQLTEQGQIVDLQSGQSITPQQLIERLSQSPRVIVGEKHDNLYHHQIEQWLSQEMHKMRPQGSVLLEMIKPDQQASVSEVKAQMQGDPYIRDEKLQSALHWQKGWPWEQYGELTKSLLKAPYPLLSANLNTEEINQAYKNPPVLNGVYSTQPIVQELISQTIETSHDGKLTPEQVAKMTVIQQMRDRRMAKSLLQAPTPAMLFAGGYHATRAIGVPLHIQDLAPEAEFKVLIISEKGNEIDNLHADYVWYTPSSIDVSNN
ncbi:ChaN family lipoprotein [Providencia stuartii]|uniref:ChaN family lipoprotein n=1 Tax=Providencia TaxID=586 RepID=UPI0027FEFFE0|nr:ChaN family lipoprotein [Providencia sp. 2023EL-00965]ELR5298448.1 ChaN family lipoprotein [Providencia stuartii]ELR5302528.1 ChaN family lipoprotein [Providencia stuartii]MDW7586894.1 ChaN family lipoprotein [Providencia sp. 2023EL-00965]